MAPRVVDADDSSITIQELLATSDTANSIKENADSDRKSADLGSSGSDSKGYLDREGDREGNIVSTEKHQEYRIDLSALSEADLAAVRSQLDDMFSEFDNRGNGALQQDDVRRLILQWAAEPESNSASKGLMVLPMLPPTSLSREEVVAFINHLDSDQNGEIELEEFANFILEGMALDPEDRRLYGAQSSLHSKLMAIIENVERRLVTMLMRAYEVKNDDSGSDVKEDWSGNDAETIETKDDEKSGMRSTPTSEEEAGDEKDDGQVGQQQNYSDTQSPEQFQVTDAHTDTFLRALFKEYDVQKTGDLGGKDVQLLMRHFSKGEPRFDVTDDEVVTFISAMDKDGDGK
jgi:Ca2+-binding EF-hand superfamily protein